MPVTGESPGWSFASAREPASFTAARDSGATQTVHAWDPPASLCGIPEERVLVIRSLFWPGSAGACPVCSERAAAAPTVPSAQERLHDKVLAAAPGPLRDRLLDALRRGARITLGVNGPADQVACYARPDSITTGAEAVGDLLRSGGRLGVERVSDSSGEFVVVLPEHGAPVIAFAAS
jgi:hypothetical protein